MSLACWLLAVLSITTVRRTTVEEVTLDSRLRSVGVLVELGRSGDAPAGQVARPFLVLDWRQRRTAVDLIRLDAGGLVLWFV